MKFLLRSAVFTYALLFLPDPLFAADHPPLPLLKSGDVEPAPPARGVVRKIAPESEFFSSSRPLPSVTLPPDWSGRDDATPAKRKGKDPLKRAAQPIKKPADKMRLPQRKLVQEERLDEERTSGDAPADEPGTLSRARKLPEAEAAKTRLDQKRGGSRVGEIANIPLPERRPEITSSITRKDNNPAKVLQPDIEPTPVVMPVPPPLTKWEDDEIATAQQDCKALLADIEVTLKPVAPIRKGECGTPAPVRVSAVGVSQDKKGGVKIKPAATLNCKFTARFANWVRDELQPLAQQHLGAKVKTIHNMSSYSCRRRYNGTTTKISEHALANALDIGGMTLTNGVEVSVLKHWDEHAEKSDFLKAVHKSACEAFVVVLGPEANEAHKNHFHFDVGRFKVCE